MSLFSTLSCDPVKYNLALDNIADYVKNRTQVMASMLPKLKRSDLSTYMSTIKSPLKAAA